MPVKEQTQLWNILINALHKWRPLKCVLLSACSHSTSQGLYCEQYCINVSKVPRVNFNSHHQRTFEIPQMTFVQRVCYANKTYY